MLAHVELADDGQRSALAAMAERRGRADLVDMVRPAPVASGWDLLLVDES
jgi:hypothetical protein